MNNGFNQKQFQALLKKGIGNRTQREFAAQTGIAPATINRMLNDEDIACPKLKTLETFASHMENVSLVELMSACGYSIPKKEEVIAKMESDIFGFFAFGTEQNSLFFSFDEIAKKITNFLQRENVKTNISVVKENIPDEMKSIGAEEVALTFVKWEYDQYICTTKFHIYFAETKGGKIILIGSDLDMMPEKPEQGYIQHTSIKSRVELRTFTELFNVFLGMSDEVLPSICIGIGFECNETPAGFEDFLHEHADTFCDSKENIELYNRVVCGEDPEVVFEDFVNLQNARGIGAVLAEIMQKETGKDYFFFDKGKNVPEEQRNACVMFPVDYVETMVPIDKKVRNYLYKCAKQLQIPEFGVVYHRTAYAISRANIYKTDKFVL